MAVSNISICNLALTMLSTQRISSLSENTENARKLSAIYDMTRDALLSLHNWNFARAEKALALVSGETDTGWSFIYQLPVDCLRVISIVGDYKFRVFSNKLYTNADSPVIEYQRRITDPTLFSAGFVKALASRLAADLAFGITQNATLTQAMEEKAALDLREAKWNDAQEGEGTNIIDGSLLEYR